MTSPPETDAILDATKNTPRANIIADLVGQPHSMPTRVELEYMNPSIAPNELSEHLDTLADVGVVQVVEGKQHTFYCLTDRARSVFDENNLFDEDTYKAAYEEVSKSPDIQALEDLDRPVIAWEEALLHTNSSAIKHDDGNTFDTTGWEDAAEDSLDETPE